MFQLVRTQFQSLVSFALTISVVIAAPAFGKESPSRLSCSVQHANGEVADAKIKINESNKIDFEACALKLHNVVALIGHSHSLSLAFSSNMDGRRVYTFVIHRDFFLPHPDGYDPSNPPATLTIQHANSEVVPSVDVFTGDCTFI